MGRCPVVSRDENEVRLQEQINDLAHRRHEIWARELSETSPVDHDHLAQLEVQLEQAWDELRRHRAGRDLKRAEASAAALKV
jgi:hypothetical protein